MWTLTSYAVSNRAGDAFSIRSEGNANIDGVTSRYAVFPTLYLNSKVKVVSGNGSITVPYQFVLD